MTAASEPASTLLGAALLAASVGGFAYSGLALVRRPLADAPLAVRLAGAGLVGAWLLVVVSLALLFGQCFHAAAVAAVSLGVAGACWRWAGKAPPGTGRTNQRPRLRGAAALLAALASALLLVQAARALVLPPLAWDSLTYHMTIPALWIQRGGYWQLPLPDAWGDYSHFPANGELFGAFLMLPFRGDLLANLFGLPFLLLGGAAVHGLATELGACWRTAGIAAALWMFTPPAFAYVTTQYVDLPMAAETAAGWLFLVRFLRTRRTVDGVLAGAAFGLAVGTKHLALVPAAVAAGAALWLLVRQRGRVVRGVGGGALAAAAVGAPWYVRNWIETGNPVYPFPVAFGGHVVFAGSTFQANVPKLPPSGDSYLAKLLTFQPEFAPITFGPPVVLVAVLGLLGLLRGLAGPARGAWLVLLAAMAADLLLFCGESMRLLREQWSFVSQRFLLVPFALLLVGMATQAQVGPRWRRFVLVLGAGALALDLAVVNFGTLARDTAVAWLVLGMLAVAAVAVACRPAGRWLAVAGAAAWLLGLPLLAEFRSATRHDSFVRGFDLHLIPRPVAPGWSEVDQPDRPLRIAFVSGWATWGHEWMVYPLLGSRLQNEVVHVPTTSSGALGTYQPHVAGEALATPAEWIARLRRAGVQVLFVALPAPPELAWAEAHPDVFALRKAGDGFRVFDVR